MDTLYKLNALLSNPLPLRHLAEGCIQQLLGIGNWTYNFWLEAMRVEQVPIRLLVGSIKQNVQLFVSNKALKWKNGWKKWKYLGNMEGYFQFFKLSFLSFHTLFNRFLRGIKYFTYSYNIHAWCITDQSQWPNKTQGLSILFFYVFVG